MYDSITPFTIGKADILRLEASTRKCFLNGSLVDTLATGTIPVYQIPLFAEGESSTTCRSYSYSRIYYCKMWDNDSLVRDYIPCYRKSDGIIGLYDISGQSTEPFYTNAGSGTFSKGNDVSRINPVVFNINKFGTWNITQDGVTKTVTANKLDLNQSF